MKRRRLDFAAAEEITAIPTSSTPSITISTTTTTTTTTTTRK
jgi:hypothetical protein